MLQPATCCQHLMDEAQIQIEFRDYLDRASRSRTAWYDHVVSFEEFRDLLGRWQREYHDAWAVNDTSRMAELERALVLDA
jgi:hypothetical protein